MNEVYRVQATRTICCWTTSTGSAAANQCCREVAA